MDRQHDAHEVDTSPVLVPLLRFMLILLLSFHSSLDSNGVLALVRVLVIALETTPHYATLAMLEHLRWAPPQRPGRR